MKILSQTYLQKKESEYWSWFIKNRYKIYLLLFFSILFSGISSLPYVNLFLNRTVVVFTIFYMFLCLFFKNVRKLVILGSIFLFLSFPAILIKENLLSLTLGDFTFGIFFLAVIYKIFEKN